MRRIGGHVSTAGGLINAVKNTLEIGGNAIQIFAGSPRMWKRSLYDQADADDFISKVKDNDLYPVYIHALYLTNLASDNDELRDKSKNALITDMKNCSLIKSSGVVLHIGSHQGRGFDSVKNMIVDEIRDVLSETPEDSILLLENTAGQKGKIGNPNELSYLLENLDSPRVRVCIDTAHAFESGHAIHEEDGLENYLDLLEKSITLAKIDLIHLNDSKTDFDSRKDNHENIGVGKIGSDAIGRFINHKLLKDLPLILEVPGFDGKGPDKKNIDIVKSLLK